MLHSQIEHLFDEPPAQFTAAHFDLFQRFKDALNRGEIRAAEPDSSSNTGWRAVLWVKKGILLGFRMGAVIDMSSESAPLCFHRQIHLSHSSHVRPRRRPHRSWRLQHS